MSKIFGIGLPKTGTNSLNTALEILGFRSYHSPFDNTTVNEIKAENYKLSILQKYDALTDIPIPAIYAQLDRAWPDSKFILTVRDRESWLDSCKNAPFNVPSAVPESRSFREFYRMLLYGCVEFDEERFALVHESHQKQVLEFFSDDKKDQLLILDICGGEGWEKLCPFLGKPISKRKFPYLNRHKKTFIQRIFSLNERE